MAKRRMFLENLVESDDFCSLPHAAQALYLHLGMSADDDGLVGNPNRIMRSIKIPKKNLDLLCEKEYVIMFESGVIAITHWLSNNCIKKDRYTPTRFKQEFSALKIVDGCMYIKAKSVICGDKTEQNKSVSAPQVSIGKDSIVKINVDEVSIGKISEGECSTVEVSAEQEREGEISGVKDSFYFIEKEIKKEIETEREKEKNKGPSPEGPLENDEPFSVYLSDEDRENEKKKFISQLKLYIMTAFKTLDDKGFIQYYESRKWLDKDNKPIFDNYKYYVNDWMSNNGIAK